MTIKEILQKIGLSPKEIQVFLSASELHLATAYEIAKRAKLKRTTAYAILDQLEQKKFVSSIKKKSKKIFAPISPHSLIDRANERIEEAKTVATYFHELAPLLQNISERHPSKPNVVYYQNRDGIRDLHNEMLHDNQNKTMYYLTAVENIEKVIGKTFFTNWINRRVAQNTKSVGIRNKSKEIALPTYNEKENFLRDYRLAPSWVNLPLGLYICGNKVAIISSEKESFGLLIESPEYSILMKSLFDALWQLSSK